MHPILEHNQLQSRRNFLGRSGAGIGIAALANLLGSNSQANEPEDRRSNATGGLPGLPHGAVKAKRVIYLCQSGAPSQMDLFDYKPSLENLRGTELPSSIRKGQRLTGMTAGQAGFPIAPTMFKFAQHGRSGAWLSELLPHTSKVADELCIIKSLHTEAINHETGASFLLTGNERAGWPSIGAWLGYRLGASNQDLPPSAVMISLGTALGTGGQPVLDRYWGNGFLPSKYRAVKFRSEGDPVLYLKDPPGVDGDVRQDMLAAIKQLNQEQFLQFGDPEILSRSEQYDMAMRMQRTIPNLIDTSDEPESVLRLYGDDVRRPGTYAANCLLARRMAERGMRFIQLCHRGWDAHGDINHELPMQCRDVDQASAALLTDLENRGMLDDTLVVFGAEFGRTNYCQGSLDQDDYGRDHHPRCFTTWMAGAGVKAGISYGQTDDFSYNVVNNPVPVHDFQATLMHLMGIDHERLTFKHQGRRYRLTDVHGHVVKPILA